MKQKDMMWTFMIKFGSNMWGKKTDVRSKYYLESDYHDTMYTDKKTFQDVIDFLPQCGINTVMLDMGEGMKFDSHPELALPGSWEKAELKEELQRMREMGITPLPKLNFSAGHNAWLQQWGNMIGTDVYDQTCKELVEEMIDVFDTPEFFHLGLDEELYGEVTIPERGIQIVRGPHRFVEDAKKLFEICRNKGVRPWIWMEAGGLKAFGGEESFRANVPKDVLISNWYYYQFELPETSKYRKATIELYKKLGEWGYEQLPCCSTWDNSSNIHQTMEYCKQEVAPESIVGYMSAPWIHTIPSNYYGLLHGAWKLACAKKDYYPED